MENPRPPAFRTARVGLLFMGVLCFAAFPAIPAQTAEPCETDGRKLVSVDGEANFAQWREKGGWADMRPFSNSAKRFSLAEGALRLETVGDSFIVGRKLPEPAGGLLKNGFRYLRYRVRIVENPAAARADDKDKDDSAFRLFVVFQEKPLQALAYIWGGDALPVGTWVPGEKNLFADFRQVRRKVFGKGAPPGETVLTVEVDLLRDFREQFSGPLPHLEALAFQADSNDLSASTLAYLWSVEILPTSLRSCGLREGDTYQGTKIWFR